MDSGVKYFVLFQNQPIGYIIDMEYFEPCSKPRKAGYLDDQGNFTYSCVSVANLEPRILGNLKGGVLTRTSDGTTFTIEPEK